LSAEDFLSGRERATVIDFWRILDEALAGHPAIEYLPFGRGADDSVSNATLAALWAGGEATLDVDSPLRANGGREPKSAPD
jgi:hypothetical protein